MNRILILDDDAFFCRTLKKSLGLARDLQVRDVDYATSPEKTRELIIQSVQGKNPNPYDIFLIDQYLGGGQDGISLVNEFRRISASTDVIVMTGQSDPDSGQRAYAAGAARYLDKPFKTEELIAILNSLKEWRRELKERAWMQAMVEINMEAGTQQKFEDVARVITEGALRLGFERARLFWVPDQWGPDTPYMAGISMAGKTFDPDFCNRRFRIDDSPYISRARESGSPLFFSGREHGDGVMEKTYGLDGFQPPVGEWACLPLIVNGRFSGALSLDSAERERALSEDQRKVLQLFGRQVSAILEWARSFNQLIHNWEEIRFINHLGKQITVHIDDLDRLLEEIRSQLSRHFSRDSFYIALLSDEDHKLDFPLQSEQGQLLVPPHRPASSGLADHLLHSQDCKTLFLPNGLTEYCQEHNIRVGRYPTRGWIGAPLLLPRMKAPGSPSSEQFNQPLGVLVTERDPRDGLYTEEDKKLLEAVADQVAGAIYVARIVSREQERLNLLQKASAELVKLVNEDENWMWQALLNIVTASYGLKFNRAWLFLAEAGQTRLSGVSAVGDIDTRSAHRAWERDLRRDKTFEQFLQQLRQGKLRPTPLEAPTRRMEFTEQDSRVDYLFQVLRNGGRQHLSDFEAGLLLPKTFVDQFSPSEVAIVPLRAGERAIGLVIVDNKHNGKPVEEEALNRLETFLNMAGLVYTNERRRAQQETFLSATRAVVSQTDMTSLQDTLNQICNAARLVNGADWVTVYPLREGGSLSEYDIRNTGSAGELLVKNRAIKDKLRQRGVSAFIMSSGRLIVNDITADEHMIDGNLLKEHPFIERERIKAFIGVPVLDQLTYQPLGVLYLDYRKAQRFTQEDVQRAETFANLAGIAVRMARSSAINVAGQRELNILQTVLKGALTSLDEQQILRILLNNMRSLLQHERINCRVVLAHQETRTECQPPELVLRPFTINAEGNVIPSELLPEDRECVIKALEKEQLSLCDNNQHAIAPIRSGIQKSLGVLDVRDPEEKIMREQQSMLSRFAAIAALALDNARRQENLISALKSAWAFTGAAGLNDTLQAIVDQIRVVSPDISALTIWYLDERSGMLKHGPLFGVIYPDQMIPDASPVGSVVRTVMDSPETIWAEDTAAEKRLLNKFVEREGIRSSVGFPLRSEDRSIGAMFFNYRQPHHFTTEERSLFLLLAEIVVASIQDAIRLEEKQHESERLKAALDVTEAIGASLELPQIIEKALQSLYETLDDRQTSACLLIYKEHERCLEFSPASFKFYQIDVPGQEEVRVLNLEEDSIVCKLARESLRDHVSKHKNDSDVGENPDFRRMITNTRSQFSVSLFGSDQLLGVLALESPQVGAFDEEIPLIQGVAQQISLAIERVNQRSRLQFKDTVATATAWASDVAHDINREVGVIRDHLYFIRKSIQQPELIQTRLDQIEESAIKLSSFGARSNMTDKLFQVNEGLRNWFETMDSIRNKNIDLRFDFCCEDIMIETNPASLQRALRHLVRNAVQAMQGEGTLTVRTRVVPDDLLEIQLEDTGPGIPASVENDLFEKPATTKQTRGGKGGYGLLLVRQMIESMHGSVFCLKNEPGRGAVFCIRLPLKNVSKGERENAG